MENQKIEVNHEQEVTSEDEETCEPPKKVPKKVTNQEEPLTKLENSASEVQIRLNQGCDCSENCFEGLDCEEVFRHRLNIADLTKTEHEFYLMGVTMSSIFKTKETLHNKDRKRQRLNYVYMGNRICLLAFLYLENVTPYLLKKIRSHVLKNGVVSTVHGNKHKKPHNALSLDCYKKAENFVRVFLNLPKNINSSKTIYIDQTKSDVYKAYTAYEKDAGKVMGSSSFRQFFKKQFPTVKSKERHPEPMSSKTSSVINKPINTIDEATSSELCESNMKLQLINEVEYYGKINESHEIQHDIGVIYTSYDSNDLIDYDGDQQLNHDDDDDDDEFHNILKDSI